MNLDACRCDIDWGDELPFSALSMLRYHLYVIVEIAYSMIEFLERDNHLLYN